MGCKYWECKYNNLTQKGGMADCYKPNGSNIRHPCLIQNGDYCTEGEPRDDDKITGQSKDSAKIADTGEENERE
jgi:hypothetical protein